MLGKIIDQLQAAAKQDPEKDALISYITLRKAIGWLGMLMPVMLIGLGYFFGSCKTVQPSISHYYFTNVREIFTGVLFSVALFLFCYKGCSKIDSRLANFAGLCALLVALFPTKIILKASEFAKEEDWDYYYCQKNLVYFWDISWHNVVHFTAAALFFLTLAVISIALFTISDKTPAERSAQKKNRNRTYRVCGGIMIVSVACIAIYFWLGNQEDQNPITLIFESIALLAFGFSWLTKGEVIFPDKK